MVAQATRGCRTDYLLNSLSMLIKMIAQLLFAVLRLHPAAQ